MSQRTLVEINHDMADFSDQEWVAKFRQYISSGSPVLLPKGVTFFYRRHHSEDCPMGDPPRGWSNTDLPKDLIPVMKRSRLALAARLRKMALEAADLLERGF